MLTACAARFNTDEDWKHRRITRNDIIEYYDEHKDGWRELEDTWRRQVELMNMQRDLAILRKERGDSFNAAHLNQQAPDFRVPGPHLAIQQVDPEASPAASSAGSPAGHPAELPAPAGTSAGTAASKASKGKGKGKAKAQPSGDDDEYMDEGAGGDAEDEPARKPAKRGKGSGSAKSKSRGKGPAEESSAGEDAVQFSEKRNFWDFVRGINRSKIGHVVANKAALHDLKDEEGNLDPADVWRAPEIYGLDPSKRNIVNPVSGLTYLLVVVAD